MTSEWREYAIGEIGDVVGGSTPSTRIAANFDGEIPWLTPKDLAGVHARFVERGERSLSQRGLDTSSAQLVPAGSVLLSTRAPIGYVAIAANPIATNQGFRSLVLKPEFDSEFVYYWMLANTEVLERHANGSTFKELSGGSLRKIRFSAPPLGEQRAIAHILGALDDKIELSRRTNESLEAIARALFKSWFVAFDPVRAKSEGRDPGLPPHLADLFPDSFEDSELGEIPSGWRVGSVDDEFNLTMGQSPPGDTYNFAGDGVPFYQGRADFGFRFPTRRVYCSAPTRFAKAGDTLVSVRAPVGDVNMASEDCAIGRGLSAVRHYTGSRSYSYRFMHSIADVFAQFEAEGTVFGSIGKREFHAITCVMPPRDLVLAYEMRVSPFDDRVEVNERETGALAARRDALLPKLISGDVRVDAARTPTV